MLDDLYFISFARISLLNYMEKHTKTHIFSITNFYQVNRRHTKFKLTKKPENSALNQNLIHS